MRLHICMNNEVAGRHLTDNTDLYESAEALKAAGVYEDISF